MNQMTLKPLTIDDASLLFQWRNDPFIVALGSLKREVIWEEHFSWVNNTLVNKNRKVFIILIDGKPSGQIRFDKEPKATDCVISIYLLEEITGKGLGIEAIQLGNRTITEAWKNVKIIFADVLKTNTKAQKAFLKAGYQYNLQHEDDGLHENFIFQIDKPISHSKISFDVAEINAISQVIKSGYWAEGTKVKELEKELKEITQRKYAIAVSTGLSALRIALLSFGIQQKDEVIIPAYSCVALANAVLSVGAIPVPVDIELEDFNISFEKVREGINPKTKAIVAVHTFGAPAAISKLKELNLPVIEDCAHGFGLQTEQGLMGNLGDIAICSFYATKFIGGGEGGAILTNNIAIAKRDYDLRDYTDKAPSAFYLNEKMSDIHAAITLEQVKKINFFIQKRENLAANYMQLFKGLENIIQLPKNDAKRIWYRFSLLLQKDILDEVIIELGKENIMARKPVELWIEKQDQQNFPNATLAFSRVLSLPIYPSLTTDEQDKIIQSLKSILAKY